MSAIKVVGVALIALGIVGLAYGGFTYTRGTHDAKIGPIELSVSDRETVNIPFWAGAGTIVAGALLLLASRKS